MRDQYAGDVSDVLKLALLRSLAGNDRKLGVAWYYVPGNDGKPDGRHLEWRTEPAWKELDGVLHTGLTSLPDRSVTALEALAIWPPGSVFYTEPMPSRAERMAWAARKRHTLENSDLVFLDPDNGIGTETAKHATFAEIRKLRRPGRAVVFITFPGRNMTHELLLANLHARLRAEADASQVLTLRTNVSVPRPGSSTSIVQRQRWFTIVDPDAVLIRRSEAFAHALGSVPRVKASLERDL